MGKDLSNMYLKVSNFCKTLKNTYSKTSKETSSIKWLDFDHVIFTLFLDMRNVLICFIYISSGSPSLKVGVGPVIQILMIDQRFRRRQSLEIITCIQSELSARTFSIWIDSTSCSMGIQR